LLPKLLRRESIIKERKMISMISNFLLKNRIRKKDLLIIGFVFVAFILTVILINNRLDKNETLLKKSFRYSVCITTGKVKNVRSSGPDLDYRFKVNGITYGGSQRFKNDGTIKYNNGRYYVIFQPENPKNNKILLKYPVPDEITEVPDSGWKVMPISKRIGSE
jgi:hypothetical protein